MSGLSSSAGLSTPSAVISKNRWDPTDGSVVPECATSNRRSVPLELEEVCGSSCENKFEMDQAELRSGPDQTQWYAVRVRPQQEAMASQSLRNRGLEEFLPTYTERRRWADRVKVISCPLFTGYVFCRFTLDQKPLVLASAGCVQVVKVGTKPSPIPDEDIRALRHVVESGRAFPHPYLNEGRRVRICTGPFKDIEGYIQKIKNEDTLVISLHILQRSVSVHLERDAVQAV